MNACNFFTKIVHDFCFSIKNNKISYICLIFLNSPNRMFYLDLCQIPKYIYLFYNPTKA